MEKGFDPFGGVAAENKEQQKIGDLLKVADKLLYQAKHEGKNYTAIEEDTVFNRLRTMQTEDDADLGRCRVGQY